MAGFFSRLFGGAANENEPASGQPDEIYEGIEIHALPQKEGSQWRVAGMLRKPGENGAVERRFMRADTLPDEASARTAAIGKARLIIDQNGPGLWTGEDRMV